MPTPAEYGIPYEDLTLDTPDRVRIRAYLLLQLRELPTFKKSEDGGGDEQSAEGSSRGKTDGDMGLKNLRTSADDEVCACCTHSALPPFN